MRNDHPDSPTRAHETKWNVLQHSSLFATTESRSLDALCQASAIRRYDAGEQIVRRGERSRHLLIVVSGRVKLANVSPAGAELLLDVVRSMQTFGEVALLDSQAQMYDGIATQPTEVMLVPRGDLKRVLASDPEAAAALMRLLCERLRATTALLEETTFLPLPARLLRRIRALSDTRARHTNGGVRFEHRLSQQELAEAVGACRESVNKQLAAWQARGFATVRRGVIVFRDEAAVDLCGMSFGQVPFFSAVSGG